MSSQQAKSAVSFQEEKIETLLGNEELNRQIADRLHGEKYRGSRPNHYDYETYVKLERSGLWRMWTARLPERQVGLISYFIRANVHNGPNWRVAMLDLWFVDQEFRSTSVGYKLWLHAEDAMIKDGVSAIMHSMSAQHSYAPLLEKKGYRQIETIYEKIVARQLQD